VDAQGRKFSTNTEAEGRFHSKWLNMMLPRLYLARNLLREDGVIFVSIDDNEAKNLKVLCDDIFGEEQFIAQLIWKSRQQKDNRNTTGASVDHEYVLCYGKKLRGETRDLSQYSNPDNDPRGDWTSSNMVGLATQDRRPNLHYDLIDPTTGINYGRPRLGWRYDQNTMFRLIAEQRILWPASPEGRPRRKAFLTELKEEFTGFSSIIAEDVYTKHGTEEGNGLFGANLMDFPKPVTLIQQLLEQGSELDSITLDFFSGSCTTAHAVLDFNRQDGGTRKFIRVQLPEPCDENSEAFKAGYKTIAEIGKERIRRVIKKLNDEDSGKLDLGGDKKPDRGFRVYKLDRSNFKIWDSEQAAQAPGGLAKQLEMHELHIDPMAAQEDILYELLLKAGFPLTIKVEKVKMAGKDVFSIADGKLMICLERAITKELIKALADTGSAQVICLDEGFKANDQLKTNAVQTFKARRKGKESEIVFRTV
jgi:adenine-specific DNA-methyltransferase